VVGQRRALHGGGGKLVAERLADQHDRIVPASPDSPEVGCNQERMPEQSQARVRSRSLTLASIPASSS
jgi:hypothetical protein